ncbi:antibiotic biosynthesis monooxygenase [Streptomyces sp. NPDC002490]|uniref:antibiotic biosynthesis monooxygenase n=1 Tax=Streptomyces sp. NPDC002490 TaxID=3154416 RepID=UPI0033176BD1
MPYRPHPVALPDLTLSGTVTVTVWSTDAATTPRVLTAVDRAWRAQPEERRPPAYAVCAAADGSTLLHYARWPDDTAATTGPGPYEEAVRTAAPVAERLAHGAYHRYRTGPRAEGEDRTAGCLVVVTVTFDGADPDRQRDWTDGMFAATGHDPYDRTGVIAAHFHTSADGTEVLNLAEWESEEAHRAAFEGAPADPADPVDGQPAEEPAVEPELTPEQQAAWARVVNYPGITGSRVVRHVPLLVLAPSSGADAPRGGRRAGG